MTFQEEILQGIPAQLPPRQPYDTSVSHAPRRKDVLSTEEKKFSEIPKNFEEHVKRKLLASYTI